MAGRVRGVASSMVGTEPWRLVNVEFPGTEASVVEAAKVSRPAAAGQTWPDSSDEERVVVVSPARPQAG